MNLLDYEPRPDFFPQGNCWQRPELNAIFFPNDENTGSSQAKAYCERCPVATECRDYAINNDILHGIWGGLTYRERERYRRNPAAFIARKSSCEECGTLLEGRRRLFCSQRCVQRSSARRKRQATQNMPRVCQICGDEFIPSRSSQRLCTPDCQKQAERLRSAPKTKPAGDRRTIACWQCNTPFRRIATNDRYCSDRCRAASRRLTVLRYNERQKTR